MRRRDRLSADLLDHVLDVEPSRDAWLTYRPCRVVLRDGAIHERVVFAEARPWFRYWGVDPEDDEGKAQVLVAEVASVLASPHRLPAAIAMEVYRRGETRMGGTEFRLRLRDGRQLDVRMGNLVDFPAWPDGVGPDDVVELLAPGPADAQVGSADFAWCLYER